MHFFKPVPSLQILPEVAEAGGREGQEAGFKAERLLGVLLQLPAPRRVEAGSGLEGLQPPYLHFPPPSPPTPLSYPPHTIAISAEGGISEDEVLCYHYL